ncbi:MAG TPA: PilN domain-containing protein [Kofleriaceae bacterium]|nr:PilN domain-containing protein [Kofleriaceae bacterium]
MIKIHLVIQKRARRGVGAARGPRGFAGPSQSTQLLPFILIGVVLLAGIVFFALHRPLASESAELAEKNKDLTDENAALKRETKNSRAIRTAFESELARQQATSRLREARVSPAWLMFELSNVLTPGKQPQLTPEMQAELKDNPNRPWQEGWDPKHVWITQFTEKAGKFKLEGAAQSKGDVIELGLRLRASMFFDQVSPTETDDVSDKDSGLTYHKFAIEGNVRY